MNVALSLHGQWLPLDPPFASEATIGGILATNDSGPLRHRYGTPRDLVIGTAVATADGVLAKSGGQVVKNVAGYDLSKLLAGSFGSLAAIVNATFKLSPLPAASRTLVAAARDAEELGRFVREVMASQLEPIAFEIHVPSFALMLRFASVPAAVDAQAHAAEMMLGAAKLFEGDAERAFWSQHNERVWTGTGAIVRASWLPANLAAAIGELKSCAATSGVIEIEMLGRAAVGSGLVRIEGEAKAQARAIEQLRRSAAFGNVVLRRGSTGAEVTRRRLGRFGRASTSLCVPETCVRSAGDPQPGPRSDMSASATFDGDHPPSRTLIDACVHCGFCLPSCPTYALWGEEMDSPRGRLYLMKAGLEGRMAMGPSFVQHFDACLGCMACVTACPSGVQYAPLIEATRGQIDRRFERSWSDRLFRSLIFALFPFPGRLRIALLPLALFQYVARAPYPPAGSRAIAASDGGRFEARAARRRAGPRTERLATSPPRDARAGAEGDVAIALHVAAGTHARQRSAAHDGRSPHRMCAARHLSARESGHRQRPGGRRV